jgi:hypothetical protein
MRYLVGVLGAEPSLRGDSEARREGSAPSYGAITTSIGTPNSTGQRCAYRARATNMRTRT